jgi:hypothetical protein
VVGGVVGPLLVLFCVWSLAVTSHIIQSKGRGNF